MTALLGLLRIVPLWLWIAMAALLWGGWQRHRAAEAAAETAELAAEMARLREHAAAAALTETTRRLEAQTEATHHATLQAARARADAASAAAAADVLRQRAAALAAGAGSCDPALADGGAPAADAAHLLADVLGRAAARAAELAAIADERGIAGAACERAYDALSR